MADFGDSTKDKIGECRGCGNLGELRESHIIPELAYRKVYTRKHRYAFMSGNNRNNLQVRQKGLTEVLLCPNCENRLSKLENHLKMVLEEIKGGGGKHVLIKQVSPTADECTVDDPTTVKLAILSILWRMSISSLDQFRGYELGPYENKIRELVFGRVAILEWYQFPVWAINLSIGAQRALDVMMLYPRAKYHFQTLYKFCILGIVIWVIVTASHPKNDDLALLSLKSDGTIVIQTIDILEEMQGSSLSRRLSDPDIKRFYERHG